MPGPTQEAKGSAIEAAWMDFSIRNRSRAGTTPVILSAAKDLGGIALPYEILRCAQDDGYPVNGCPHSNEVRATAQEAQSVHSTALVVSVMPTAVLEEDEQCSQDSCRSSPLPLGEGRFQPRRSEIRQFGVLTVVDGRQSLEKRGINCVVKEMHRSVAHEHESPAGVAAGNLGMEDFVAAVVAEIAVAGSIHGAASVALELYAFGVVFRRPRLLASLVSDSRAGRRQRGVDRLPSTEFGERTATNECGSKFGTKPPLGAPHFGHLQSKRLASGKLLVESGSGMETRKEFWHNKQLERNSQNIPFSFFFANGLFWNCRDRQRGNYS